MLQTIHNGCGMKRPPYVDSSNLQEPVWFYCPKHARVLCNERANSQASKAPITRMITMSRPELLQTIRDNLMNSEITIEETTQVRQVDWGFDYGTSSCDRKRGGTRRVANKCETGTLLDIVSTSSNSPYPSVSVGSDLVLMDLFRVIVNHNYNHDHINCLCREVSLTKNVSINSDLPGISPTCTCYYL